MKDTHFDRWLRNYRDSWNIIAMSVHNFFAVTEAIRNKVDYSCVYYDEDN